MAVASHSDATKARALVKFREVGTVKGACKAAGIGRQTWYDWLAADPAFAAQVREATEDVTDELEEVAVERAKDASDTLMIFLLKSRRPEKYRERQEVSLVHPDVQERLRRQVALIASRPTWNAEELLRILGEEVWT